MPKKITPNSVVITNNMDMPTLTPKELALINECPDSKYYIPLEHRINFIYTAFIKEFGSGYVFKGEKHGYWEMLYVLDGDISVSEDGTVYNMKKGDAIFHMPHEFHSLKVPCDNACKLMIITFNISSDLLDELGNGIYKLSDELHTMLMSCYNYILDGFLLDFTYVRKKNHDHNRITEALAILSLEKFILEVISKAKKRARLDNSTGAENYKRIIDVMSEHIRERLTIEDIANYCYMTPSNVQKTFNKYSGGGILNYFNSLKITRAKELIRQGYSSDFISSHLGYSSPSYFSRAFKKIVGMSPQQYKRHL